MKAFVEGIINGLMVYWKEVPNAASYRVRLFVGENVAIDLGNNSSRNEVQYTEIAVIDVPRNIRYHTFKDLAWIESKADPHGTFPGASKATGKWYCISVEAEDRAGEIIEKTDKIVGKLDHLIGDTKIHHQ